MVLARRLGELSGGTLIAFRTSQGPTIKATPRQPNRRAFHFSERFEKASAITGIKARNTGLKSVRMPTVIPSAIYDAVLILALSDSVPIVTARLRVTKK